MIQWNVDTLDWKTRNADKTVAAVLNHVKDGDIILMHELYGATGDAVARIVPELHKRGFQMVTVSQMAAAKGRSLEAGKLYSSFHYNRGCVGNSWKSRQRKQAGKWRYL